MTKEELEKRCNELFFQVNEKTERIAELEKENAELKESLKKWKDAIYADVENYNDQLTKAKELLKQLVDIEYAINIPKEKIISLMVKAEQFLSEVEK